MLKKKEMQVDLIIEKYENPLPKIWAAVVKCY